MKVAFSRTASANGIPHVYVEGEDAKKLGAVWGKDPDRIDRAYRWAAADDMLVALENLENDDGKCMPPSAWKLVQDAIAKARGETA